jgi:hypothetical protein
MKISAVWLICVVAKSCLSHWWGLTPVASLVSFFGRRWHQKEANLYFDVVDGMHGTKVCATFD